MKPLYNGDMLVATCTYVHVGGNVGVMKIVELYMPEKGLMNFCVAICLTQNNRVPRSWRRDVSTSLKSTSGHV